MTVKVKKKKERFLLLIDKRINVCLFAFQAFEKVMHKQKKNYDCLDKIYQMLTWYELLNHHSSVKVQSICRMHCT